MIETKKEIKETDPNRLFEIAKKMIESCKNPSQLIVIDEKVQVSKHFTKEQKAELKHLASAKVDANS